MDDPTTTRDAGGVPGGQAPGGKLRPRIIAALVAVVLIGAAYVAGLLQGRAELGRARTSWQTEKDQMSTTIETGAKELAALKFQQALWQLDADASEILADLADKNYGLARDVARESSTRLSGALATMDNTMKDKLQPLSSLLDDTSRAADSLDVGARAKAQQARALIRQAIAGAGTPAPSQPDKQ